MYLIYHEFVLALKDAMCKFEKLSVCDFPSKSHKKIILIYFQRTNHFNATQMCLFTLTTRLGNRSTIPV